MNTKQLRKNIKFIEGKIKNAQEELKVNASLLNRAGGWMDEFPNPKSYEDFMIHLKMFLTPIDEKQNDIIRKNETLLRHVEHKIEQHIWQIKMIPT